MVEYKYGTFSDKQMKEQKKSLHAALFWLLLYKDPVTAEKYSSVDVDNYIDDLMIRFAALNGLFNEPPVMPSIMSKLEAIKVTNQQRPFDYHRYRKLVLDAQTLVDKLYLTGGDSDGV